MYKRQAQQASSSLSAFRTQLTHVRQSIASLQASIHSADEAIAVEQDCAVATRDCNACAQILVDASSTFQKLLGDRMGVLGADIATQDRLLADMRSSKAEHVSQDETRALKVRSVLSQVAVKHSNRVNTSRGQNHCLREVHQLHYCYRVKFLLPYSSAFLR